MIGAWLAAALVVAAVPGRAEGPARIVSLAPSLTETLFALGAGERLVGVCGHCNHPDAARRIPRVGGYLAPSVEAVLAVRPDLVVAVPSPGNREAVRALERMGVRVLVVPDRTLDDLFAGIAALADAVGRGPDGTAVVARIRSELDAVAAHVAHRPRRRVLLVVGHSPLIVAGGATLQDALVRTAGGVNVAADIGAAFPQIGIEVVVARAPEVIIDAAMGTESGGRALFAGLDAIPAVRDRRIVSLSPDVLFRAGPRVAEAARLLASAIHPDAFAPAER